MERWRAEELKIASMCSGSGVDGEVFVLLANLLPENLNVQVLSVCEKEPKKQAWLQYLLREGSFENACLFENAEHMHQQSATCLQHKQPGGETEHMCSIRKPFIASCGFSCKLLSRMNSKFKVTKDFIYDGLGSTGKTFEARECMIM